MQGQCLGFEALSRFANGCPPDVVWDYAETTGVAMLLDQVAIRKAVAAAQSLPGKLFLNIRALHLSAAATLPIFGSPDHIVWEVTESHVADHEGKTGSQWLRQQGYALALDDAGAGWSTPHRLKWLRPQIVKLDYGIVHQWARGTTQPLKEWVTAAHAIGALILAEGVEDSNWAEDLAQDGVGAVQGYAFGKPAGSAHWTAPSIAQAAGYLRSGTIR
jgi:EAL domain-containing protein (putative c-di-GMP-specific phosphodiesterase class I)